MSLEEPVHLGILLNEYARMVKDMERSIPFSVDWNRAQTRMAEIQIELNQYQLKDDPSPTVRKKGLS